MDVVIDPDAGSVYVGLHDLPPGAIGGVTHTLEKHGVLLHWDGRGTLTGVTFKPTGDVVRVLNARDVSYGATI